MVALRLRGTEKCSYIISLCVSSTACCVPIHQLGIIILQQAFTLSAGKLMQNCSVLFCAVLCMTVVIMICTRHACEQFLSFLFRSRFCFCVYVISFMCSYVLA